MSEEPRFTIGSEVECIDGPCGELTRIVVNPVARSVTHIVVEHKHRRGNGRLVPVGLVVSAGKDIRLRCSLSEFGALDAAEETQLLPGEAGEWGYGEGQILSLPYYALGGAGMTMGGPGATHHVVIHDRVPPGEVEVRRGDPVHATDGSIGHVRGLVVDPADHHVTHVLLDEGHLWGRKTVAIPITAVRRVDDGVRLNLTRGQVGDLPAVELDLPD